MGDGSFIAKGQADRERSCKADHGKNDVSLRDIAAQLAVLDGTGHDCLEHGPRTHLKIRPFSALEKRVDHIDHADAVVESGMHVLTKRVDTVGSVLDSRFTSTDALFQRVASHRVEKCLLIGKVSVKGADANAGALGNGIARRRSTCFKNCVNGDVQKPLTIPLCIRTHGVSCSPSSWGEG